MTSGDVAMIMSVGGLASGFSLLLGEDFLTSRVNRSDFNFFFNLFNA